MADKNNPQMVKDAFDLYLKYNGEKKLYPQINAEMEKLGWANFKAASRFPNRGKGKNFRTGWIDLYGWEKSLQIKIAMAGRIAATSAESLLLEVEVIRKKIFLELESLGVGKGQKDLVYQHDKYVARTTEILDKLAEARDNYANFVTAIQHLTKWAPMISTKFAEALAECEDAILDQAEKEFVKPNESSDDT